ncbi:precorrin-2 C(20)-methyltransferase [Amycolatopsis sp. MtRt-6]|uniref:precorrin-2 C(20)-methyltransferase n=1 Tax=Amycolatopsis sp. MtRt-6 TaxID=2792782 RepID=UPI001A8C79B1|nr:precorrin-2 C(20)-methyltransferase [Amycolatopsis sp. MtRt-6]
MSGELLVGVGVGPGDPELLTVKGVRVLQQADVVVVPAMEGSSRGRAERTVLEYVSAERIRRLTFALNERHDSARRERAWDAAGKTVVDAFENGARTVAFATIGDPNIYSTFTYLAETVLGFRPDVEIATVPGITAMQELAAGSGTVLCEGDESLVLLPVTGDLAALHSAVEQFDNVVVYKGGARVGPVLDVLRSAGRIDGAVYGSHVGLPDQDIRPATAVDEATSPYLTTILVPQAKTGRGRRLPSRDEKRSTNGSSQM